MSKDTTKTIKTAAGFTLLGFVIGWVTKSALVVKAMTETEVTTNGN